MLFISAVAPCAVLRPELSPQTCATGGMSTVPHRVLPSRPRLSAWPVRCIPPSSFLSPSLTDVVCRSPKPGIPPPKAYEPPEPPSVRDLGPPPPGYGRYADFDRGGSNFPGPHPPGLGGSGGPPGPRRNLEDVVCYKVCSISSVPEAFVASLTGSWQCGEKGHYANHCRQHAHKPYKR